MIRKMLRKLRRHVLARRQLKRDVNALRQQEKCRIIIGASGVVQPGWLETNLGTLDVLNPNDWKRYFTTESIDAMLAEHVWEHLTEREGSAAARSCWQYLKPGGYLRLAVPDGRHIDPVYIDYVRPGGHGPGADEHKVLYTRESLVVMLENAGFEVSCLEFFDDDGQFHSHPWEPDHGMIHRSIRFDERNHNGRPNYTSLIVDATKRAA